MQFTKASVLAALVAYVAALQVTSPSSMENVDLSKSFNLQWSSVSTDPTSFSIVLVNQQVNPSVSINIADNVQTSSNSFSVPAQAGLQTGGGYQFNLISKTPNNLGILAQSGTFDVTKVATTSSSSSASSSSSSASSSSSSASSSSMSGMTTSTTTTGSSSSAAATTSGSSTGSSSSSGSATGSATTSSASTKASAGSAAGRQAISGAAGLGVVGALVALLA